MDVLRQLHLRSQRLLRTSLDGLGSRNTEPLLESVPHADAPRND
ncbi:hypothetical protein RM704_26595 [Streptomyces sp. DSM 3412]|uniref:MarR family transcriptional regulator n=1 Tax=Streptomyces gottesmaniae TaxID=3075518 RepID=A0ABU2Z5Q0_9ACTN|nr:hypothetical protein [Streptomyces sp. DSM 3412]MDT0570989.1 hypothetical protein [Streptomyces sp. DSM 3412]